VIFKVSAKRGGARLQSQHSEAEAGSWLWGQFGLSKETLFQKKSTGKKKVSG
jgi:hypothetical protein